jgi:predicted 3-demethylubiquinone-9 3-methyltransferase (glyoxalase superfamily)
MQKITPFLWFDKEAEEAVNFYASVFPESRVGRISRYPEGSPLPAGTVMTAEFYLAGQDFIALNGGPGHPFNDAVSFVVNCQDQDEVDRYWNALTTNGGEAIQCGWLKDKYGLNWQIVPIRLNELMNDPDPVKSSRVMQAMLKQVKLDVSELEKAYHG